MYKLHRDVEEEVILEDPISALTWRTRQMNPAIITRERRYQPRDSDLSQERVARYALDMSRGDKFPPITVGHVGKIMYLLDGFHRVEAADKAGLKSLEAVIAPMDETTAILVAIAANAKHGLNLTGKDKRRCFQLYCECGGHLHKDGTVKSLRHIRRDLGDIAWPNTISAWLRKAGIEPTLDEGPSVDWAEDHSGPELEEFEDALSGLENIFHRLDSDVRRAAVGLLNETALRLVKGEVENNGFLDV